MLLYYDNNNIVRLAGTSRIVTTAFRVVEVPGDVPDPVGKRLVFGRSDAERKMRLAVICNWDDACGIATYTKYLIDALAPKLDGLHIFSEGTSFAKLDTPYSVSYTWKRGGSMKRTIDDIIAWGPSVVLIQHEYGIFPKASYFLQMMQLLHDVPHVVTMHSVYEHLDKTVATSGMSDIICHSEAGRECLGRLGNRARVAVIPHGCVPRHDRGELWNTWQTPYPILQFGFGFNYKGVDIALEAISTLKKRHGDKYKDIFYTYYCSENQHVRNVNDDYARRIARKIGELGLHDNAAIVRGYQSEETLNNILRTSRMAIFPYVTDPKNVVYGASGAIRLAMANSVPTVASSSHMFDDLDGVLPRPDGPEELAEVIDKAFSDGEYRRGMLSRAGRYVAENSWEITADRYLGTLKRVRDDADGDSIFIEGGD